MAPITHLAFIVYKSTVSEEEIAANLAKLHSLKDRCIHPATGKPYMLSLTAGADLDNENLYNGGFTHALCMTFANKEDWLYYTQKDPVHTEFITTNKTWEKGIVIDIGGDAE
jgi:hypothetical protein